MKELNIMEIKDKATKKDKPAKEYHKKFNKLVKSKKT